MDIKFIPTPTQQKGIDAQLALENADRAKQKLPAWTEVDLIIDHLSVVAEQFYSQAVGSTINEAKAAIDSGLVTPEELKALIDSKK